MAKSGCSSQSGRSPGFRVIAVPAPSGPVGQWLSGWLTDYSGASAAASHRFPYLRSSFERHRAELAKLYG